MGKRWKAFRTGKKRPNSSGSVGCKRKDNKLQAKKGERTAKGKDKKGSPLLAPSNYRGKKTKNMHQINKGVRETARELWETTSTKNREIKRASHRGGLWGVFPGNPKGERKHRGRSLLKSEEGHDAKHKAWTVRPAKGVRKTWKRKNGGEGFRQT